jgi:hypothetical protein
MTSRAEVLVRQSQPVSPPGEDWTEAPAVALAPQAATAPVEPAKARAERNAVTTVERMSLDMNSPIDFVARAICSSWRQQILPSTDGACGREFRGGR